MPHQPNCIFCQIARGAAPAHIIRESATHLAFLSIFPNTDGFSVVIPRNHHHSYVFANEQTVINDLMAFAKEVALQIDRAYAGDVGRTGVMFEGFGVDHLHAKLFPMHGSAAAAEEWEELHSSIPDKYFVRYEGYMSSHNGARVSDEKLADIAAKIRAAA